MSRSVALSLAALAVAAVFPIAPAALADDAVGTGLFGAVLPLSAQDLAGITSGGPLVLSVAQASGGTAENSVAVAEGGQVSIRSRAQASASVTGAPIAVSGGTVSTGDIGGVVMENGAGISSLEVASGVNNIQQNAVSFVFVVSELPQP